MARYIELNQKKITRLKREAQQFQDDIVCAVGKDFLQEIAEAENRMIFDILNGLESEPTTDVVPKSEVAMEIFEEVEELLKLTCGTGYFGYIGDLLVEIKKKYVVAEE